MPRLRLRHVLPPSVVPMTPAVDTATRNESGLVGSTEIEWIPGANSPPSDAGVPNQSVAPRPSPENKSPPRDS
jgi:hypothetical protein